MTTDFAALATTRELRAAMTAVSRQPDLVDNPDAFLSLAEIDRCDAGWGPGTNSNRAGQGRRSCCCAAV
jgi:hypothetical protein